MSTNEPTAAQAETRKCVATKNRYYYPLLDGCGGTEWHGTREACSSTEEGRQSCAHHDPVYLPEAELSTAPARAWKPRDEVSAPIFGRIDHHVRLLERVDSTTWLVEYDLNGGGECTVNECDLRPEPSAPTQDKPCPSKGCPYTNRHPGACGRRDPDCAYCVRQIPDERCTCVPSRNAPVLDACCEWHSPRCGNDPVYCCEKCPKRRTCAGHGHQSGEEAWDCAKQIIRERDAEIATLAQTVANYEEAWGNMESEIATLRAKLEAELTDANVAQSHYSMLEAQNFDLTHQVEALRADNDRADREYRSLLQRSADRRHQLACAVAARDLKLSEIAKVAEQYQAFHHEIVRELVGHIIAIIGTEKS